MTNLAIVSGKVYNQPELRYAQVNDQETPVAEAWLTWEETVRGVVTPHYLNVSAWRNEAENLHSLVPGQEVTFQGRLGMNQEVSEAGHKETIAALVIGRNGCMLGNILMMTPPDDAAPPANSRPARSSRPGGAPTATATAPTQAQTSVIQTATLNAVSLVGRVGGDPEVKYFESGSVKAVVRMAVNRRQRNSDPDWFKLEFWGKTAEIVAQYVGKGSQIGVTGRLSFDYWTDRTTGAERSQPIIKVEDLNLLGGKRRDESEDDEF